jgi:hypothetical protein
VNVGSGIDFVASSEVEAAAEEARLSQPTTDAIVESYEDAQIVALKAGLLVAALIGLVSLAFTRELPHAPPASAEDAGEAEDAVATA